mgnify:CR=1 FL=1|tara:strand:+ start:385 stop:1356 length:972 start_codon:yes stop_codon:yes gene_type:complete
MNTPFKQKKWNPFSRKKKTDKEKTDQYKQDLYNFIHTGSSIPSRGGALVSPDDRSSWHFRGDYVDPSSFDMLRNRKKKLQSGIYEPTRRTNKRAKNIIESKYMGNSPIPQLGMGGTGTSYSFDDEGKGRLSFSANPTYTTGKLNIGGDFRFSPGASGDNIFGKEVKDPYKKSGYIGGKADINIGSRRYARDYDATGFGRISLGAGINISPDTEKYSLETTQGVIDRKRKVTRTNPSASARFTAGIGRPSESGCYGGMCYAPSVPAWNIGAFGEISSDSPGGKFGISGRYGALTGEAGYDLATKQRRYQLGLSFSPSWGQKQRR